MTLKLRFSVRDLFWLTLAAALATGWVIDAHKLSQLTVKHSNLERDYKAKAFLAKRGKDQNLQTLGQTKAAMRIQANVLRNKATAIERSIAEIERR